MEKLKRIGKYFVGIAIFIATTLFVFTGKTNLLEAYNDIDKYFYERNIENVMFTDNVELSKEEQQKHLTTVQMKHVGKMNKEELLETLKTFKMSPQQIHFLLGNNRTIKFKSENHNIDHIFITIYDIKNEKTILTNKKINIDNNIFLDPGVYQLIINANGYKQRDSREIIPKQGIEEIVISFNLTKEIKKQ